MDQRCDNTALLSRFVSRSQVFGLRMLVGRQKTQSALNNPLSQLSSPITNVSEKTSAGNILHSRQKTGQNPSSCFPSTPTPFRILSANEAGRKTAPLPSERWSDGGSGRRPEETPGQTERLAAATTAPCHPSISTTRACSSHCRGLRLLLGRQAAPRETTGAGKQSSCLFNK